MHNMDDFMDAEDGRVFGVGKENLDGKTDLGDMSNVRATGMAGRAKQFVPFAALRGFNEMIEKVSSWHDNIDEHQDDQEG